MFQLYDYFSWYDILRFVPHNPPNQSVCQAISEKSFNMIRNKISCPERRVCLIQFIFLSSVVILLAISQCQGSEHLDFIASVSRFICQSGLIERIEIGRACHLEKNKKQEQNTFCSWFCIKFVHGFAEVLSHMAIGKWMVKLDKFDRLVKV